MRREVRGRHNNSLKKLSLEGVERKTGQLVEREV